MFNQLAINPAYAGSKEAISTSIFYRNQWTGIDGAPKTETVSIHGPMRNKKAALGLTIIDDIIGPKDVIGILGSYAYRIKVRDGKLSFGLRLGAYRYTYRWNIITHKDQTDNVYTDQPAKESKDVFNADAGLYYYTNTMYAGLSLTHLNNGPLGKLTNKTTPNGDYAHLSTHLFLTFGKAWTISEKLIFSPSCMIKIGENSSLSADQNLSFLLNKRLWLGLSIRAGYGIVVYTQFNITDKLKIGYAYDFGINKIANGYSSHEIMISYDFKISKPQFFSPRYF